jgi:hypothetical protein
MIFLAGIYSIDMTEAEIPNPITAGENDTLASEAFVP